MKTASQLTYRQRLQAVHARLSKHLPDTSVKTPHIEWVKAGWGMAFWNGGLWYVGGSSRVKYKELSGDRLKEMIAHLPDFAEKVEGETGLVLEPAPKERGPGVGHYFRYACSSAYRDDLKAKEKEAKIAAGMERLEERRAKVKEDLADCEAEEKEIVKDGRAAHAAKNESAKNRLKTRLKEVREHIAELDTQRALLAKKARSVRSYMHNKTVADLGDIADLPDAAEVAKLQVSAEEAVVNIDTAAESAVSVVMEDEDDDGILDEFAQDPEAETSTEAESEFSKPTEDDPAVVEEKPVSEGVDENPPKIRRKASSA